MKRKWRNFILFFAVTLASVLCVGYKVFINLSFFIKQQELAKRLGVNLNDYSYSSYFPENYFYSILKPGMTKQDVHKIIKEYEIVFSCNDSSEIYYFYSKDSHEALRFKILYDEDGKYSKLIGEDNSGGFYDKGCGPGLLKE